MTRPFAVAAVVTACLSMASVAAFAQSAPATKPAATKSAPKPATSHAKLKSEAKGLALATETVEAISANQLAIASRVLTGNAQCEFNQQVSVQAIEGKPGVFKVAFKNQTFTMVPEETTTGAVRLEDKKAGVVWLQIPAKSMLMNAKVGQRMVDACTQAGQRAAVQTSGAMLK